MIRRINQMEQLKEENKKLLEQIAQLTVVSTEMRRVDNSQIHALWRNIEELTQNPVVTFPDGSQIALNCLTNDQYAYLHSLAVPKEAKHFK